jgi:hypothetical protein
MEVRVGSEVFRTKKDLLAKLKKMLHAAELGVELGEPEHSFLLEMLKRHPEHKKKVGPGVRAFRVTTSEYKNRCFEVIRVDGTETDFSYTKCVTEPTPLSEFTKALRKAVEKQLWEAKEKVFLWDETIPCPVSGETMTREQAVVEYVEPNTFDWIVEEFCVSERLEKNGLPMGPGPDGGIVLTDPALEARWQAFHERKATFRVLSANEQKRKKNSVTSNGTDVW